MPKKNKKLNGNVPNGAVSVPGKGRPRIRLTGEDQLLLLRLHEKGRKPSTIARLLSRPERPISLATVRRYLQQIELPNAEVQRALARLRLRAVESWETAMTTGEKFGKHTPAKDLLIATGAIRSDQPVDRLIIVVGNGRDTVGQLPAIPAEFTTEEGTAVPGAQLPVIEPVTSDNDQS